VTDPCFADSCFVRASCGCLARNHIAVAGQARCLGRRAGFAISVMRHPTISDSICQQQSWALVQQESSLSSAFAAFRLVFGPIIIVSIGIAGRRGSAPRGVPVSASAPLARLGEVDTGPCRSLELELLCIFDRGSS